MSRLLPAVAAIVLSWLAASADAQYARPGATPSAAHAAAARPAQRAPAPAARAQSSTRAPDVSPVCFEPMNPRDITLSTALLNNGLLCATATGSGMPVALRATPAGDLTSANAGTPNVFHRLR